MDQTIKIIHLVNWRLGSYLA